MTISRQTNMNTNGNAPNSISARPSKIVKIATGILTINDDSVFITHSLYPFPITGYPIWPEMSIGCYSKPFRRV